MMMNLLLSCDQPALVIDVVGYLDMLSDERVIALLSSSVSRSYGDLIAETKMKRV
jgi:hypothetical protein